MECLPCHARETRPGEIESSRQNLNPRETQDYQDHLPGSDHSVTCMNMANNEIVK